LPVNTVGRSSQDAAGLSSVIDQSAAAVLAGAGVGVGVGLGVGVGVGSSVAADGGVEVGLAGGVSANSFDVELFDGVSVSSFDVKGVDVEGFDVEAVGGVGSAAASAACNPAASSNAVVPAPKARHIISTSLSPHRDRPGPPTASYPIKKPSKRKTSHNGQKFCYFFTIFPSAATGGDSCDLRPSRPAAAATAAFAGGG
jgi:hypothetical protein